MLKAGDLGLELLDPTVLMVVRYSDDDDCCEGARERRE
jgi:hypothetical protein